MTKAKQNKGKLTEEQFVLKAIETLRKGSYRGIHTVFSGFNEAFRTHFGEGADPIGATAKLQKAGAIVIRPCRGGVMLYKADEAPPAKDAGATTLSAMGL